MVNRELILDRLSRVRENIKHLKEIGRLPLKEFASDFKATGSAERLLQVSIEACLDIGNHIISRCGLERPKEYEAEVYEIIQNNLKDMEEFVQHVVSFVEKEKDKP